MKQLENSNSKKDTLDHLENGMNENYDEIFRNHKGLIANKWIHYFYIYDKIFSAYRKKNKPLTFLEIGVAKGGSLEIWKKYFPDDSKIYGVDINPKCREINFSENIYFHLGSASDRNFMEKTFKDIEFDIILDDGSHVCSDVIETFKIMFPKLKNSGVYVVEDLHTSYWHDFGGGRGKKGTSIAYFKSLVEALNSVYLRPSAFFIRQIKQLIPRLKNKIDKMWRKYYFKDIDYYAENIESITFFDSICAINKFSTPKNIHFKSVHTGDENIGENYVENEAELIQRIKNIYTEE